MLAMILALTFGLLDPSVLAIPVVHAAEKSWTPELVKELARDTAQKYKLNTQKFLHTLNCENQFKAKGQSEHFYKGKREMSFGAAQINLPSHPTISREQAEDPDFAIHFMAEEWAKSNAGLWSCWNNYNRDGWPKEKL